MCHEILSQGNIAVIFKNEQCHCINVTLPNINIHLEPPDFSSFAAFVHTMVRDLPSDIEEHKLIQVTTPYQGMDLHFRVKELKELNALFKMALLKLEAKKVLASIPICSN